LEAGTKLADEVLGLLDGGSNISVLHSGSLKTDPHWHMTHYSGRYMSLIEHITATWLVFSLLRSLLRWAASTGYVHQVQDCGLYA